MFLQKMYEEYEFERKKEPVESEHKASELCEGCKHLIKSYYSSMYGVGTSYSCKLNNHCEDYEREGE